MSGSLHQGGAIFVIPEHRSFSGKVLYIVCVCFFMEGVAHFLTYRERRKSSLNKNKCSVFAEGLNMNEDSEARKRLINPDFYEPIEKYGEQSFEVKIGNTVFQIETHYDSKGRVSVMKQFQDYLLKNIDASKMREYSEDTDAMPGCQEGAK